MVIVLLALGLEEEFKNAYGGYPTGSPPNSNHVPRLDPLHVYQQVSGTRMGHCGWTAIGNSNLGFLSAARGSDGEDGLWRQPGAWVIRS